MASQNSTLSSVARPIAAMFCAVVLFGLPIPVQAQPEPAAESAGDDPFSVLGFDKKPDEAPAPQPPEPPKPAPDKTGPEMNEPDRTGPETPSVLPAEPAPPPAAEGADTTQADIDAAVQADLRGDSAAKPAVEGAAAAQPPPVPDDSSPGDLSIFGIEDSQLGIESQTPEQQRHRRLIEAILERLESQSEKARLEAAVALKETVLPADVPLLVQSLKSGGGIEKQTFVAETLGDMHDVGATGALRNELEHGELPSRIAAARALGRLGNDYPVPLLSSLINQPGNEELALSSIAALGRIGSNAAVYALKNTPGMSGVDTRGRALKWALSRATKKHADETTEDAVQPGRKLERYWKGTKYMYYQPDYRRKPGEKTWMLVCVHGSDLDVDKLFETCVDSGRKHQVAVLAPYFDYSDFPDFGELNIRGLRADKRLFEIIDHLGSKAEVNTRQIYLYGLGRGADFAQRFAFGYPERIARAAGWFSETIKPQELSKEEYFPVGTNTNPFAPDLKFNIDLILPLDFIYLKVGLDLSPSTVMDRYMDRIKSLSNQIGIRARLRQGRAGDFSQVAALLFGD